MFSWLQHGGFTKSFAEVCKLSCCFNNFTKIGLPLKIYTWDIPLIFMSAFLLVYIFNWYIQKIRIKKLKPLELLYSYTDITEHGRVLLASIKNMKTSGQYVSMANEKDLLKDVLFYSLKNWQLKNILEKEERRKERRKKRKR